MVNEQKNNGLHGASQGNAAAASALLAETIGPVERLALVYAPAKFRPLWLGYLALESRLARTAQGGKEPMLAQIKLAWWRERFDTSADEWPSGEPLLAVLSGWDAERAALSGLVDGWEDRTMGEDGGVRLRSARVEAMLALSRLSGANDDPDMVRRATLDWCDGEGEGGNTPRLTRAMRPLAVLRVVALRAENASPLGTLLVALRAGLFGR